MGLEFWVWGAIIRGFLAEECMEIRLGLSRRCMGVRIDMRFRVDMDT